MLSDLGPKSSSRAPTREIIDYSSSRAADYITVPHFLQSVVLPDKRTGSINAILALSSLIFPIKSLHTKPALQDSKDLSSTVLSVSLHLHIWVQSYSSALSAWSTTEKAE